jgi:hypothetical protein
MSASFEFDALKELAKEIAALPATIRAEFKPTVVDGAGRIQSRVASAYAAEGVESVGAGMRVEVSSGISTNWARSIATTRRARVPIADGCRRSRRSSRLPFRNGRVWWNNSSGTWASCG